MPEEPEEEVWESAAYGGEGAPVDISQESLGRFMNHILRLGGSVLSTWVMNRANPTSFVHVIVLLPKGRKQLFEQSSGFTLHEPIDGPTPEYMLRSEEIDDLEAADPDQVRCGDGAIHGDVDGRDREQEPEGRS